MQYTDRVCGVMRQCAVSGGSHLQYEERKCLVLEGHICSTKRGCAG